MVTLEMLLGESHWSQFEFLSYNPEMHTWGGADKRRTIYKAAHLQWGVGIVQQV